MTGPDRRSPLAHRFPQVSEDRNIRLEERRFLGKLILRGRHDAVSGPVEAELGTALPDASPGTATGPSATILWLSPDEWMIVTEPDAQADLAKRLGDRLDGIHHQIADVTDYYTILSVAGAPAREMLMKLTMLDMHERSFAPGEVRATMMMHTQAVIHQRIADDDDGGPGFDIYVRWSLADYLWCLVAEAGREFGLPAQEPVAGERLVI